MPRYVILAHGAFDYIYSKTGNMLIRYRAEDVCAVIDSSQTGKTADAILGWGGNIPCVGSFNETKQFSPTHLVIGSAPQGGTLDKDNLMEIDNAIDYGCDIISGMHVFLNDNDFLKKKSKANVAHHYDISDDLYDLFLDPKRQYSCAYFKNENDTLEDAQNNKIDHLIKKLNLEPNQKCLDIGSGWGSLAIEIAKKTKCHVTGITLSENQYKYSLNKAKENNLENQVQFKLADYRELTDKFDRIVSVGMFEHVGRKFYKTFFKQINNLLSDKGLALIHTIGSIDGPRDPQPWISKYIFPGGYTPSMSELSGPIEKSGLILSDIEVLRMHYSHTLRNWKERFLNNKTKVLEMFDEKFFRMWEFYLTSCEMVFKWGDQVVFQFQLTKDLSTVPTTRDYIYK